MIVIHHNKDMDGYCSGAICKLKYPEARLIGWDYSEPIPEEMLTLRKEDIIMIDITFPLSILIEIGSRNHLTVIDHHISFKKQVDEFNKTNLIGVRFIYIYEDGIAACEIGWKYLFGDNSIPHAVTLISRYDTWRKNEGSWDNETLPFNYYMYSICNSAKTFPLYLFNLNGEQTEEYVDMGKSIMKYQETMDESAAARSAFERIVFGNLRGICLNARAFSSETLKSVYDTSKHDIMVGFEFTGTKWSVSLRSDKPEVDVSVIAKQRGGGGHKGAAGFEVDSFDKIFN